MYECWVKVKKKKKNTKLRVECTTTVVLLYKHRTHSFENTISIYIQNMFIVQICSTFIGSIKLHFFLFFFSTKINLMCRMLRVENKFYFLYVQNVCVTLTYIYYGLYMTALLLLLLCFVI